MSSRNISNLLDSTGYIAVLAVGMTLVIVIRHIDLSVGYAAGFMGAIAAILLSQYRASGISDDSDHSADRHHRRPDQRLPRRIGRHSGVRGDAGGDAHFPRGAAAGDGEDRHDQREGRWFNAIGNGYIPAITQVGGLHCRR